MPQMFENNGLWPLDSKAPFGANLFNDPVI